MLSWRANTLLLLAGVAALALVFVLKANVTELKAQQRQLLRTQQQLGEDIRVLLAEYAFLTEPSRLSQQAQALGLQPQLPTQVVSFAEAFNLAVEPQGQP